MVETPSSRQARMTRMAISPRFATRSRRNGGVIARLSVCKDTRRSERDVAVLLRRHGLSLVLQHRERSGHPRARLGGKDHLVDVPASRRDVRVRKALLVL